MLFKKYLDSLKYERWIILAIKTKKPCKFINFLGILVSYFLKLRTIHFLPISVDIEPNNNCNLRCRHCQVTYSTKDVIHLDSKSFKYILNQLPYLLSVKLQGMGEPFLNEHLIDMLKAGEKRGISMQTFTNGTIFNKQLSNKLVQLKNTSICFSIDGATSETHEKIRLGSKFDKIQENIRNLINCRSLQQYPRICIWSVITKQNVHETNDIVKLAKYLGVDFINLQTSLTNWGKKSIDEYLETIKIFFTQSELSTLLINAQKTAKTNKINLHIHSTPYSKRKKCHWPWTSAFIAVNGDVVPCCVIADSNQLKMGNIFEKSFSEIWNSRVYQELREQIRTNNLPEFCKNCYTY